MNDLERMLARACGIADLEPSFSFSTLGPVCRVSIHQDAPASGTAVELLVHATKSRKHVIAVTMKSATGRVCDVGPWLGPSELFIDDVSSAQMEGVAFHVHDGGGGFDIYCKSVEVTLAMR